MRSSAAPLDLALHGARTHTQARAGAQQSGVHRAHGTPVTLCDGAAESWPPPGDTRGWEEGEQSQRQKHTQSQGGPLSASEGAGRREHKLPSEPPQKSVRAQGHLRMKGGPRRQESERGDRQPKTSESIPPVTQPGPFSKQGGEGTPRVGSRAAYLPLSSATLGRPRRDMSWLLVAGAGRVCGEKGGMVRMASQHQEWPGASGGTAFKWHGQATPRGWDTPSSRQGHRTSASIFGCPPIPSRPDRPRCAVTTASGPKGPGHSH